MSYDLEGDDGSGTQQCSTNAHERTPGSFEHRAGILQCRCSHLTVTKVWEKDHLLCC